MPDRKRPVSTTSGSLAGWRRGGVILAVVIGLIIFSVALAARQPERTEERSERPAQRQAMSVITVPAASTAAPTGAPAFAQGSLPALLELAPDQIDDDTNGLPVEATFADIEGWLAHLAVDAVEHPAAELKAQLQVLELPEVLVSRGLSTEWRDVYGFDLRQVDQVLAVGDAPNQILIMPGRYDVDALYETWVRSGYQAVEVEEQTVWSLFPGDQIDLSAPASRPALGMLNNVILLGDGTLIASARQSRVAEVLRVVNGDDDSLFDNDLLRASMLSREQPAPFTAVIASGRILQDGGGAGTSPAALASPVPGATPAALATPLPEVELVLFEWLPAQESHDTASITMMMLYDDAPEGFASLPSLFEQRVQGDDAWSSQYQLVSIGSVGDDDNMIKVHISPSASEEVGLGLIDDRDLGPFTWSSPG